MPHVSALRHGKTRTSADSSARLEAFEGAHNFARPPSGTARSGNLLKRVFEHKGKEHEGFTARYNCDRLVWFERFQDVRKAIAREKELKGWLRAKKIALIESMNPGWFDLSHEWYDAEPADYRRALDRTDV